MLLVSDAVFAFAETAAVDIHELQKIKELELCEAGKIGYTYKSMGSGFWALKQDNFRKAMRK